jgi:hypothetical protein
VPVLHCIHNVSYKVRILRCDARLTTGRPIDANSASYRLLRAQHGGKPDITGFDVRKFVQSAGQPRYDPWERA